MQPFVYFFNIITDFFKKEKNISLSFRNKFNFLLLFNISLFVIRNFCYVKYFCIEYKGEAKRENEITFDYIFFSILRKPFSFLLGIYKQTNSLRLTIQYLKWIFVFFLQSSERELKMGFKRKAFENTHLKFLKRYV